MFVSTRPASICKYQQRALSGNKTEDFSDTQCPAVCVQNVHKPSEHRV